MTTVPEIAILGHPNEGKSSVLSTLAEDDSVRVSAIPGETTECRTFPVVIDGREMLRFTDTPGFQNPSRVVAEMRMIAAEGRDPVKRFREKFKDVQELRDDVELLLPIERGAGIIYVVDGSRPVRNVDKAEMEILRLTGRPRMAIINCKEEESSQLENWKVEFRKNFNSNRVFNAHRATYAERILLLETLKSIDQDWQSTLDEVVRAFKADWAARNSATVDILLAMINDCLQYSVSGDLPDGGDATALETRLAASYRQTLADKEQKAHERIRALYKHHIFQYTLPPQSLLNEDLFSERTWHLLGLSQTQVAIASALGGAVVGAKLDLLTAGLSFGIFTGIGGAAGALGAIMGGRKLSTSAKNLLGMKIGGENVKIGPAANINLLLILINRGLLFYRHTINWAHGRRDYQTLLPEPATTSEVYTGKWPAGHLRICKAYFSAVTEQREQAIRESGEQLARILSETLKEISHHE
ncbi:GTPase/DUF3482 domain-containing protein [Desulfopila aestuarii]|uniref:50S ribosome-binding GTPase n=1 Tax=Desulfopila aestuarii DSM 18488 TaxID=1121416 RepID=A0A1M7Y5Z1_9BACT|nr:GTPase/DUF3482 domain-containing protein [Desulfopila aestuarii]SHO47906.1 50S ribosome-binding GTPase [Desulfopila aestuarii DSM 18488]